MNDKYLSLQGRVYLDSVEIGNVSAFKIKDSKFVFKLDNFDHQVLQKIFKQGWSDLDPNPSVSFELDPNPRILQFEGINTAFNNQLMTFDMKVRIYGFDNLNLIDDNLTGLVLYGGILEPIKAIYGKVSEASKPIKLSKSYVPDKKDLVKISKNLIHIINAHVLLNKNHIEVIRSNSDDTCIIYYTNGQVKVDEPLEQVIRFFRGCDYTEEKLLAPLTNQVATLNKNLEETYLSQYLN